MIKATERILHKYFIFAFFVYSIVWGGFEVDGKPLESNEDFGEGGFENNDEPDDSEKIFDQLGIEFIDEGEGIDESINKQQTSPPIVFKSQDLNFETLTIPPLKFTYDDTKLNYDLENNYESDYNGSYRVYYHSVGWPFATIAVILICIRCCLFCQRASVNENPRRGFAYNILVVERTSRVEQPAGFTNSALVADDEQRRNSDMPPSYEAVVSESQSTNSTLSSPPATLPVTQNE